MKISILVFAVLSALGCAIPGKPTDESPNWVQVMDRLAQIRVERQTPQPTPANPNPQPINVVTKTDEVNPLSQIPYAGPAIAALGLAWALARRLGVAHENAVASLANSHPATVTTSQTTATRDPST